jgi:glycine hydroxymethyltransferase
MPWPTDPDTELFAAIDREVERQNTGIQLIASENFTSPAVMAAVGSVLTNKYSEGYPGKRYYGGNEFVDEVEDLARERVKALFGADAANVQRHSGANANVAGYLALLEEGDPVLGRSRGGGGGLTHGSPVNLSGRFYNFVSYQVTPSDERLDYDQIRDLAREHRPKLIVAGATAYPRIIDPAPIREICDEVGALFLFDAAHIAGLIAGGAHPNPVPYADVVTFTTHKVLRGPRGGMILARPCVDPEKDDIHKKMNSLVFPGTQGGPLMHVIAAKAVAFLEALQPEFKVYQKEVKANAALMAQVLMERGYKIVSGGTENHMFLLDLIDKGITGKDADAVLDATHITVNKNAVPNDPRSPFVTSGLRLGTPAVTTRGFRAAEIRQLTGWIADILDDLKDEQRAAKIRQQVIELCGRFPVYQ